MTPKPFFKQPVFFLWIRCLYILNYLLWRPFGVVALGYRLATRRHQRVVAVTGSVGKTTATRAIMTLFHGDASARIHTGDNCFALVGLNLMRQGPRARWAVVEVGIGVPGQMAHYAATLQPDLVVMTALASDHVGRFAGDGALWEEKARMVRALRPRGVAVLNGDDAAVMRMASVTPARVVTFGFSPGCDYAAVDLECHATGTRFTLCAEGSQTAVHCRLVGREAVRALLAAVAVGRTAGMSLESIRSRLEGLPPTPGRMQPVKLLGGAVAICDDFKAGIETIHASLDTLADLSAARRILVLGSLFRPQPPRSEKYAAVGRHAARSADRIILVGRRSSLYWRGFRDVAALPTIDHVRNIEEAVALLRAVLAPGDVVLLKGRGEEKLARIALALSGREIRCRLASCPLENILCQACPYSSPDAKAHVGERMSNP